MFTVQRIDIKKEMHVQMLNAYGILCFIFLPQCCDSVQTARVSSIRQCSPSNGGTRRHNQHTQT